VKLRTLRKHVCSGALRSALGDFFEGKHSFFLQLADLQSDLKRRRRRFIERQIYILLDEHNT